MDGPRAAAQAEAAEAGQREEYAGGLPPDLYILALILFVGSGLLVTNLFTPLVLLGLIDADLPSRSVLGILGALVCASTALTVTLAARRIRRCSVSLLGAIAVGGLFAFYVAASLRHFDGFLPKGWGRALHSWKALGVHAAACFLIWRLALASHAPAAHLAHYMASALLINALCSRALYAIEAAEPFDALATGLDAARPAATHGDLGAIVVVAGARLLLFFWWFFGLSFGRLRLSVCLLNIAVVGGRYALTDRQHHRPTSPLRLAIMLRAVFSSAIVLVPLAPILAIRLLAALLLGRPILDTINESGLAFAVLRPRAFLKAAELRAAAARATSYAEFRRCRAYLDVIEGRVAWRDAPSSPYFDSRLVRDARAAIARARQKADAAGCPAELASLCLALCNRSFAGINSPHNFLYDGVGTHAIIEALLHEAAEAVRHIVERTWPHDFADARKRAFVAAGLHAHGCTALCLSGGGAIALYHLGVVIELHAHGLLPRVISGTSGGSIVAAVLACRTDAELGEYLSPAVCSKAKWLDPFPTMLRRLLNEGVALSKQSFLSALATILGDLTFAEAFARTGRLVSITAATASSHLGTASLLNYISHPNVLVRSAVQASCALPGVMRPGELLSKTSEDRIVPYESGGMRYRDGSFQNDIPTRDLAAQFNATHFIVSQVNAHIVPFLHDKAKPVSPLFRLQRFLVDDVRHRLDKYDRKGGYLPTELANLVSQEYTGKPSDVTIFPRPRLSDLTWRILAMPTEEDVESFILGGRRMTWPHLPRIALQTTLERALLHCARKLKLPPRATLDRPPPAGFGGGAADSDADAPGGGSDGRLRFPLERATSVLDAVRRYTTPLYSSPPGSDAPENRPQPPRPRAPHAARSLPHAVRSLPRLDWVPAAGDALADGTPDESQGLWITLAETYAFSKHRRLFLRPTAADGDRLSGRISASGTLEPSPVETEAIPFSSPCGGKCACRRVNGLVLPPLSVPDTSLTHPCVQRRRLDDAVGLGPSVAATGPTRRRLKPA